MGFCGTTPSRTIGDFESKKDCMTQNEKLTISAQPDIYTGLWEVGDYFVLSSDGLTDYLSPEDIRDEVLKNGLESKLTFLASQKAVEKSFSIFEFYNNASHIDDITTIVVKNEPEPVLYPSSRLDPTSYRYSYRRG